MAHLGEYTRSAHPSHRLGLSVTDSQPFVRRIVTRLIGVVPAAIVAAALGAQGLNTMLVASQVLLSVVLPTVIFPLVYLCSREDIMTVQGPEVAQESAIAVPTTVHSSPGVNTAQCAGSIEEEITPAPVPIPLGTTSPLPDAAATTPRDTKSYKSPVWITILGYLLFAVVIIANVYVFVQLGLGN